MQPSNAYTRAFAEAAGFRPEFFYRADNLVPGDDRRLARRQFALDDVQIRAAHTARVHGDQEFTGTWPRHVDGDAVIADAEVIRAEVPAVGRVIPIQFFPAHLLQERRIGRAEEEIDLSSTVKDVAGLLDWLRSRGGGYADALRDLSVVRVAVNQNYVPLEHPVGDGDEVAIFPPVTGG